MTPRALGHGPARPEQVVDPEAFGPGPQSPGERFDPAGPWSRAGLSRNIRFTSRGPGHGPFSPGKPGRTRGTSDLNSSHLGELVGTTGPQPRARVTRDSLSTMDVWSTQRALGPKHECPVKAGRPRGPFEPTRSHPGELVDPAVTSAWARVSQESWWTPWALGTGPDSPKPSERPHRHSDTSVSRPGLLVNPKGNRTQTLVSRDSWSNRRSSDTGPSGPGLLDDPAGPRERA